MHHQTQTDNCKSRIARHADDKKNMDKYIARSNRKIILEAAAEAWSAGVSWDEALALSTRAVHKANQLLYPCGVGKPKAKPKPKAKGRARV